MASKSKINGFFKGASDFILFGEHARTAGKLRNEGLSVEEIADKMGYNHFDVHAFLKEFERLERVEAARKPTPIDIYLVWNLNADSWNVGRTMIAMHQTIEGALTDIPESFKKDLKELNPEETGGKYIYNFEYFAIEKRSVEA